VLLLHPRSPLRLPLLLTSMRRLQGPFGSKITWLM
jgi:hypothetical protein